MFQKITQTKFPPKEKPVLIWDGTCGFCKYWVTRWQAMTGEALKYRTYQEAAADFPDFPLKEFKKASRLVEPDGTIYAGPDSAYRSYDYAKGKKYPFHNWYQKSSVFRKLSDHGYNFIAKHRPFMFKVTKMLFGSNPLHFKLYWLMYILLIFALFFMLFR
ncbi:MULTISPECIES: thiol-disulfide oxidoreductase [unclassified Leeuwenhoekiella]|uniref:thiol-disulfide oxidoreductase DCC family protein n=1 Tax=unclassified Leeuwenhoekiella TaxID=2615029 RepID=UPI000C5AB80B|nr:MULTISPECIES: thiol-disulfide oxidoreductase [unclassified Leeuwenhoekiella]MAW95732.1 thiol-disulfide oxidoreductase [Leeuwenhoekiella sp.]MBA81193.1 thiol-disulfide oxidoreductase [Leeuwenhoekiella sp.]|tara:strand:+ start:30047 stop:30526 length:480 start_codon:yes stop_codon:yes gene_type:complete